MQLTCRIPLKVPSHTDRQTDRQTDMRCERSKFSDEDGRLPAGHCLGFLVGLGTDVPVRTHGARRTLKRWRVEAGKTRSTDDLTERRIGGPEGTRLGRATGIGTPMSDGTDIAIGGAKPDIEVARSAGRASRCADT